MFFSPAHTSPHAMRPARSDRAVRSASFERERSTAHARPRIVCPHVIDEGDAVPSSEGLVQQLLAVVSIQELRGGIRAMHERKHHIQFAVERRGAKREEQCRQCGKTRDCGDPSPPPRDREPGVRAPSAPLFGAAERLRECRHVFEAIRGHRLQCLVDCGIDGGRHLRSLLTHRRGRLAEALRNDGNRARPAERHDTREHFVDDAGQAIEIAATVHGIAGALLWAHVGDRAHGEAGVRETSPAGSTDRTRDSEVAHEGVSFGEKDVLGLDVAVDDVVRVRVSERIRDLAGKTNRLAHGELLFTRDAPAQRLAGDVRHDVVQRTVALARIVERQDVRMLQFREQRDLAPKALRRLAIGDFSVDELERDLTIVPDVVCEEHGRHAAAADLAFDSVASGDDCSALARGELVRRLRVVGHVGRPGERRRAWIAIIGTPQGHGKHPERSLGRARCEEMRRAA